MGIKHSYKITIVIWGFVLIGLIADLVWTILHPRPTYFMWLWVFFYFVVKIYRERDTQKCVWHREYKRQKKKAEEEGIIYKEDRRIVRMPKMYIIEIPLILALIYVLLYLPNALWPYHAAWEYTREIAWYKNMAERLKQEFGEYDSYEEVLETYKVFPDVIPKEARYVKWFVFPGMLQANGYIYLSMKMPAEYIQDTINRYKTTAEILYYNEEDEEEPDSYWGWWNDDYSIGQDSFPGICYGESQAENIVIYLLSEDIDIDKHGYGFWVNEKANVICFFGG